MNSASSIKPYEIAFDIDGVVADTFRSFVDTARSQYGYTFGYEDITEYDFRKAIEIEESVSEAIIQNALDNPINRKPHPFPCVANWLELEHRILW